MPTTYSTVTLNGIPLDIDPETYEPLGGRRRGAVIPTIDGETVYQDRGINKTDLRINLTGQLFNLTTVQALYALYRLQGTSFPFVDFKGNIFQVVFVPGDESFKLSPIRGSNQGWNYQLHLAVVDVLSWFGIYNSFPPSQ